MTPTKLIRRKWSGFIKEGLKLKSMNNKYWAVIERIEFMTSVQ